MAESLREELRRDVESCRMLDVEATHALADARFLARGGAIHTAVDFSEIYSLIFPNDTHDEMRVFFDDTADDALLMQHEALHRLLFRREPVLLHPAHALEFQSFIIRMRSGLFVEMVGKLRDAATEWAAALQHPDAARLKEIGKSADALGDDELESAVRFCDQHLASVLLLADPRSTQPLRLINRLLRERRFAEPEIFAVRDAATSSHIKKRWHDRLLRGRGATREAASMIDSVVMAALHTANRHLCPRAKIHLVTRSSNMHQIFDEEHRAGFWDDAGGHILRHPRIFSGLYGDDRDDPAEYARRLEERRGSLRLLIRSAELHLQEESAAFDEAGAQRLRHAMRELRNDWRMLPKFDFLSSDAADETSEQTTGSLRNEMARELLRLLAGNGQLADLVQRRLGELVSGIERQQELIGWLLQSDRAPERRQLETLWMERSAGTATILMSRRQSMPYTLEFYSPEVQAWATRFEAARDVAWESMIEFFSHGLRDEDYERLLAMSYVLGSIDRWHLAEDYCQRTIERGKATGTSPHEALFFLAICLRKSNATPERHWDAIAALQEAGELRKGAGAAWPDARYLREHAIHILELHRHHAEHAPERPSRSDALALLTAALACASEPKLQIQLLNSICYYYCVDEFDAAALDIYLQRLLLELPHVYEHESQWPPLVVDTIAWSLHLLPVELTLKAEARQRLERAAKSDDLRDDERHIIYNHLAQMRAAPPMLSASAAAAPP